MKVINLLLIGIGPHAKRIYFPIYQKDGESHGFKIVAGVDLEEKRKDIERYFREKGEFLEMIFILKSQKSYKKLSTAVEDRLNRLVKDLDIQGVIIASEPLTHVMYAKWALKKGLSILMDKPISTHKDIATSQKAVSLIKKDFKDLKKLYLKAKAKNNRYLFSLMAQRRYHPAYKKIKSLLAEIFEETNCPVTSIQTCHADGQWRLPHEIVDIKYHSFNEGYGKCSHSGYHFFDIVPWFLEAAEKKNKKINNVDVVSNFSRPNDFLSQISLQDYKKIFSNQKIFNKYSESKLRKLFKNFGEIDAFNSFVFKHNKQVITLGSINLSHNSFSQRGWANIGNRDLYKGNGRVRHETHLIEQGPFQSISFISYQGKEVNPNKNKNLYRVGGEYHLDIHVFRNDKLNRKWKNYQKYTLKDFNNLKMSGHSRGHQEDARRKSLIEFVEYLKGKKIKLQSDFFDHERGSSLVYGVYNSAVKRLNNKNPLVNVLF
ncbi:Gfo/Idh/MocA family oxidoreductase [Patescibacteria group bacterium]